MVVLSRMDRKLKSGSDVNNGAAADDMTRKPYQSQIVWVNVIGFFLLHLAGVYGFYLGFTIDMWKTWLWTYSTGHASSIGVIIGAHRYYTHKCFKAVWPLRLALVAAQTLAGQNCLYIWVRDHRQHHKYSDTNADPHNSARGFFFSHIGWLMCRKHPDVIEKGKTTDMSDLEADNFVMFQKKYYKVLYLLIAMALPISVPMYFWGELFYVAFFGCYLARSFTIMHMTWLVNSAAHLYGNRPYNNKIQPMENAFVSFLAFGEGWHNYHHTFPWDYRAAELGQKYNMSTKFIHLFARCGWIYDLKQAPQSMVIKWAQKYGDGSHPVYGVDCAEIKTTPDKCAVTDLEAFKNIENEYKPDDIKSEYHTKQNIITVTNVVKDGIMYKSR